MCHHHFISQLHDQDQVFHHHDHQVCHDHDHRVCHPHDHDQVCLIDGFLLILIMRPMKHKEKEDGKEKPQV